MQQCLPEGLRNGASHQIVLKSEGGDVWHGAQLRWNGPNQLQPGYTVTHHAAYGQASHSTEKRGGERKNYASRPHLHEKPSTIPGCPGTHLDITQH